MNLQTNADRPTTKGYDYIDISEIEDAEIRILNHGDFKGNADNRTAEDVVNNLQAFRCNAEIVELRESDDLPRKVFLIRDGNDDYVLKVSTVNKHSLAEIRFLKRINAESEDKYAGEIVDSCCFVNESGRPMSFFILLKRYKEIDYNSLVGEDNLYHFFVSVLLSLNYIHYIHNIKHLDIKEENIVSREDGRIILIDFDSSDLINNESEEKRGTEGYTAPERRKEGGETGYYSDIFSLGALLFNRVCGKRPSWGGEEIIGRINNESATVEKEREKIYETLTKCCKRQNISMDFANIVMKCIEFSPEDRYQTTAECLDSIYQHYKGIDISDIYRDSFYINRGSELRWIYLDGKNPLILKVPRGIRYALNNSFYNEEKKDWSYERLPKKYLSKTSLEEVYRVKLCFDEIKRTDDKFIRAWKSGSCKKMEDSFFENKLFDIEISKIHDGDVFYQSKESKRKGGGKGIISHGDIISFLDNNDIYAIASTVFEGEEYVCARETNKDGDGLSNKYNVYRISYENKWFEIVSGKEELLPIIIMLMKSVAAYRNCENYDNILVSCYFGQGYSEKKEIELFQRALETQQSEEIRSFAKYRLGAAYLIGRSVDKDINRARKLLNETKDIQARKWKKRAYGFCASNCMLFGALIMVELIGLEACCFLFEKIKNNSSAGQLFLLVILCVGSLYSIWLMRKAIWDFNMPEALQLVPFSVFIIFYLYVYSQVHFGGSLGGKGRLWLGISSLIMGGLVSIVINRTKGVYIRLKESADYSKRKDV